MLRNIWWVKTLKQKGEVEATNPIRTLGKFLLLVSVKSLMGRTKDDNKTQYIDVKIFGITCTHNSYGFNHLLHNQSFQKHFKIFAHTKCPGLTGHLLSIRFIVWFTEE